jgi:hypothetical protein
MREVSIRRLCLRLRALILHGMKKANVLTTEQLYALERAARRERARVVAQLFASGMHALISGVHALKGLFKRAVSALSAKVARHA